MQARIWKCMEWSKGQQDLALVSCEISSAGVDALTIEIEDEGVVSGVNTISQMRDRTTACVSA
jgi:hypothetical protein